MWLQKCSKCALVTSTNSCIQGLLMSLQKCTKCALVMPTNKCTKEY